jgi:hypothetical protein
MVGIPFKTAGILFSDGQRMALFMSADGVHYTLRLGFVLRGTEETLLPQTLLDDWGHEIHGLDLYLWIRENATHFPRAELFGSDLSGQPRQCFIRELELTAGYICLAYENPSSAAMKGATRLTDILVPIPGAGQKKLKEAPAKIPFPLRDAAVEWWAVDSATMQGSMVDFSRMSEKDEST